MKTLLRATKDGMLWSTMIAHVVEDHGTQKKKNKTNVFFFFKIAFSQMIECRNFDFKQLINSKSMYSANNCSRRLQKHLQISNSKIVINMLQSKIFFFNVKLKYRGICKKM